MARLLGRESVSSDIAALFELIKNGYDADASSVTVTFENFSADLGSNGRIIVEDDGIGMSEDEIEKKWLVIGTDTKEREPYSRVKKRLVIGNKGIGRFATEKLAKKVTLNSNPQKQDNTERISIDWQDYEKKGITFNDVQLNLDVVPREHKDKDGTKLILENLRERWIAEKIDKLKIAIASLILPEQLQKATGDIFNVKIIAEDFKSKITPQIHSLLLKHAPYRVTAALPENRTDFKVTIYKENKIVRTEQVEMGDVVMDNAEYWKHFGKCKLNIYFYPGRSRYDDWTNHYKKALNIKNIRDALIAIHGVKIYRDSFWVRPYGDVGNDWLNLEAERVQANYKIGNSQVIGFVEITKDGSPGIVDTTTRERLVENLDFYSMRTFVKDTLDVMNNYRKEENKRKREQKVKLEHENLIESEVKSIKELVEDNELLPGDDKKENKR